MEGLKVTGISETKFRLSRLGKRTSKGALRVTRNGAHDIRNRARAYAPVDEGDLESAIEVEETRHSNERIEWEVGVDPNKLGDGYLRYGFRYDVKMHEDQEYKLGKKSQEKADLTGMDVGPGYLVRALWDFRQVVVKNVKAAAKAAARKF